MNKSLVLCSLLLLIGNLWLAQGRVTPIDEFIVDCDAVVISEYYANSSNPVDWVAADSCAGDPGNPISVERDLRVQITNNTVGNTEQFFTTIETSVTLGAWATAVGQGVFGNSLIQWDGVDGSPNLNYTNLNIDLSSVATSFIFAFSADHPVTFFFRVYTSSTSGSEATFNYTGVQEEFQVRDFSAFSPISGRSAVDFSRVTAFEIYFEAIIAIDCQVLSFIAFGYELSGEAYYDCNTNNRFDSTENPLVGATVTLFDETQTTTIDTTTTDSDGAYSFVPLLAGDYVVCISNFGPQTTPINPTCSRITLDVYDDAVQDFTFTTNTILNVPGDVEVTCGSCIDPSCNSSFAATGATCVGSGDPSFIDVVTGTCPEVVTRTWTLGDVSDVQVITIIDEDAPVINPETQNVTIACNANPNFNSWLTTRGGAQATDCHTFGWSNNWDQVTPDPDCSSTTVTFTASDECGNNATTTGFYTIQDNAGPVFNPVPTSSGAECTAGGADVALYQAWLANHGNGVATDLCTAVTYDDDRATAGTLTTGCNNTIQIVFSATDNCGNTTFASPVTFTIEDTTRPLISTPATSPTTICTQDDTDFFDWLGSHGGATADDICNPGNIDWRNNFDAPVILGCNGFIATVTFTATDECGLESNTTGTYTILPSSGPVLLAPAQPLEVNCEAFDDGSAEVLIANWISTHGGANASDPCSSITWNNTFGSINGELDCTNATVTFTACNSCNPPACVSTTTYVSINDTTAPFFTTLPSSPNAECNTTTEQTFINWLSSAGGAVVEDNCTPPEDIVILNSWNASITVKAGCNNTATVDFWASDSCGNTSPFVVGTFRVRDTIPPTITKEADDMTVECLSTEQNQAAYEDWLETHGGAEASDVCGVINWVPRGNVTVNPVLDGSCTSATEVTFFAFDSCGLSSSTDATFYLEDTMNPGILVQAQDFNTTCNGIYDPLYDDNSFEDWVDSNGGAVAYDNCTATDDLHWSYTPNSSDFYLEGDCTLSMKFVFTVTDGCGLDQSTTATFSFVDNTPPFIVKEADNEVYDCMEKDATIATLFADWIENHGYAVAGDQCRDPNTLTWTNTLRDGISNPRTCGSIAVTFIVSDNCADGTANTTASFTVFDETAPYFGPPAQDTNVQCDGTGNVFDYNDFLNNHGYAVAVDNCVLPSSLSWEIIAPTEGPIGCGSVDAEFVLHDNCGNSNTTSATFTVVDTLAPVFTVFPSNFFVPCDGDGNTANLTAWLDNNGNGIAVDVCSPEDTLVWSYTQTNTGYDASICLTFFNYTFFVTDECGQTNSSWALFGYTDLTPPDIIADPFNLTLECNAYTNQQDINDWLDENGGGRAQDDCSTFTWSNDYSLSTLPDGCYSIPVYFNVRDPCGNGTFLYAQIDVVDTVPPEFSAFPPNVTRFCDEDTSVVSTGQPIVYDACTLGLTNFVTHTDTETTGTANPATPNCPPDTYILRNFTVTDDCGNSIWQVQKIDVVITKSTGPCDPSGCICDNECCPPSAQADCVQSNCLAVNCAPAMCTAPKCACDFPTTGYDLRRSEPEMRKCEPIYIRVNDDDDDDSEDKALTVQNEINPKNVLYSKFVIPDSELEKLKNKKNKKVVAPQEEQSFTQTVLNFFKF